METLIGTVLGLSAITALILIVLAVLIQTYLRYMHKDLLKCSAYLHSMSKDIFTMKLAGSDVTQPVDNDNFATMDVIDDIQKDIEELKDLRMSAGEQAIDTLQRQLTTFEQEIIKKVRRRVDEQAEHTMKRVNAIVNREVGTINERLSKTDNTVVRKELDTMRALIGQMSMELRQCVAGKRREEEAEAEEAANGKASRTVVIGAEDDIVPNDPDAIIMPKDDKPAPEPFQAQAPLRNHYADGVNGFTACGRIARTVHNTRSDWFDVTCAKCKESLQYERYMKGLQKPAEPCPIFGCNRPIYRNSDKCYQHSSAEQRKGSRISPSKYVGKVHKLRTDNRGGAWTACNNPVLTNSTFETTENDEQVSCKNCLVALGLATKKWSHRRAHDLGGV